MEKDSVWNKLFKYFHIGKDSTRKKLLKHLHHDNLPMLFWDEAAQRTHYTRVTGHTYTMIVRALKEGADRIEATDLNLAWSREGKIIDGVDLDPSPDPKYPVSYSVEIRKIIAKDPIMKKWTRVISDEGESIIFDFLFQ